MKTRAARLVAHGAPLAVEEVEVPEPGAGEVVVEMAFAGVNPVDRYQVLGRVGTDQPLPRILGSEGAGQVGGRTVFLNRAAVVPPSGLWSSHVVAKEDALVPVPDGVPLEVAASVGVVGVTAWRVVADLGQVGPGDRVLVLGASGGVGSAAVSLAKHLGAEVVAQTGSEAKVGWLEERSPAVVAADPGELEEALGAIREGFSPTVVIDPLGGGFTGAAIELLEPRGRLVIFGTSADTVGTVPLQQLYRKSLTVYGYAGLIEPPDRLAEGAARALAALAAGEMSIPIDSVVPLAEVDRALGRLADRDVRGNIVLDLR